MAVVTSFADRLAASTDQRLRPLGNKLQEIAARSPQDIAAIETLADFVLARLQATPKPYSLSD